MTSTQSMPPRTPILVGVGTMMQREDTPAQALEPIDMMLKAVRAAGEDSGVPTLLTELGSIAVPRGRWRYRNPAGEIKRTIGATGATTIVSSVGVLQQALVADACEAIADGRVESALVVGADAGYRLLRAKIDGIRASERDQADYPDIMLEPKAELLHPAEVAAGLKMPVGFYAILESARRAAAGLSVDEHRDRLAAMSAKFAAIAAENPDAWDRRKPGADEIRQPGPRNPMQAFPYSRAHCSTWNVDQAGALLICSAERARALRIDPSRWIYAVASAEANHMLPVCARADLVGSPGAEAAAAAVLAAGRVTLGDIDLIDLYSCFPVAVDVFADAVGLDRDTAWTFTGGMAFAGGPFNNYFLQATARAVQLMRAGAGRTALLSCVSGILTKQALALWSTFPPRDGFVRRDVTTQVAEAARSLPVVENYTGGGRVAGCTVLHARGAAPKAVTLIDTDNGARAFAVSEAEDTVVGMEREEWVGRRVQVIAGQLVASRDPGR